MDRHRSIFPLLALVVGGRSRLPQAWMPAVAVNWDLLWGKRSRPQRKEHREHSELAQKEGSTMKKKLSVVLSLTVVLSLMMVAPVSADPPMRGTMDLTFNLGHPDCADIAWLGTITIDGDLYDMAFVPVGTGKPFDEDPNTSIHFFEEIWTIYELGTFDYVFTEIEGVDVLTTCNDEFAVPVLSGHDSGTTSIKASRYRMNGEVDFAAGDFAGLEGHKVHMSGTVEWYPFGAPHFGPGDFRLK
jgi:hypothetical protein